jgi:hypothetical protein
MIDMENNTQPEKPQHDEKLLVLRCSYRVKKDDGTGLNLYYEGSVLE